MFVCRARVCVCARIIVYVVWWLVSGRTVWHVAT